MTAGGAAQKVGISSNATQGTAFEMLGTSGSPLSFGYGCALRSYRRPVVCECTLNEWASDHAADRAIWVKLHDRAQSGFSRRRGTTHDATSWHAGCLAVDHGICGSRMNCCRRHWGEDCESREYDQAHGRLQLWLIGVHIPWSVPHPHELIASIPGLTAPPVKPSDNSMHLQEIGRDFKNAILSENCRLISTPGKAPAPIPPPDVTRRGFSFSRFQAQIWLVVSSQVLVI
jgi:hypothetical protein